MSVYYPAVCSPVAPVVQRIPSLRRMFLERGLVFNHATVRARVALVAPLLTGQLRARRRGKAGREVGSATTESYALQAVADKAGVGTISLSPGSYDLLAQADNGDQGSTNGVVVLPHTTQDRVIDLAVPILEVAGTPSTAPTPDPSA